jgi:uncharacterized repeat protein (TIGR01451 family)
MDQADGTIDNTATATGTPPGGGTVSDDDTLAVPVAQGPAIQIVKTYVDVNGGTVLLGDALTYTFTVTNTGNVTLANVSVSDPLPGLGAISPASVPSLAPGASAVFTAAYTVRQADLDQADGTIDNTATATGTPPGGGTVSDDDTLAVPVAQEPGDPDREDVRGRQRRHRAVGRRLDVHLHGDQHGQRDADERHGERSAAGTGRH